MHIVSPGVAMEARYARDPANARGLDGPGGTVSTGGSYPQRDLASAQHGSVLRADGGRSLRVRRTPDPTARLAPSLVVGSLHSQKQMTWLRFFLDSNRLQ